MHSFPVNRSKPYSKRKVYEIIVKCVNQHGIVVNAFRSKRLDHNTLERPRVIRHALLPKYGQLIAQDCFVSWKPGRITQDKLLSHNFRETRSKVKTYQ